MASREALRDFQRRLAGRLQAAPAAGVQAAWLAVEAGGGRYLLPLAQAGEIFPAVAPQPVPHTRPWFLGVANLRGSLYGVVDLAGLVAGLVAGDARAPVASAPPESQFVTLGADLEVQCALRVDRLAGLRGPEAGAPPVPPPAHAPAWFGRSCVDAAGAAWQEIDLATLSRQPGFLRVGA